MRILLWIAVLAGVAFGAWRLFGGDDAPTGARKAREPNLGPFPLSQFYLEHDRFLAATDPRTVPAADATWLVPEDEVFGVVLKGRARAYPVPMLSYHHVVNDVLAGIPIAVTY